MPKDSSVYFKGIELLLWALSYNKVALKSEHNYTKQLSDDNYSSPLWWKLMLKVGLPVVFLDKPRYHGSINKS